LEGDLFEEFIDNVEGLGLKKARNIYIWTVICSFRLYLFTTQKNYRKPKFTDMVIYHFKMALRNISKNQAFTAINIFGLTIGLASSLAILLFIIDQSQMDDFQVNQDRIYRLESEWERGGAMTRHTRLHPQLLPVIAENQPGIEAYARVTKSNKTLVYSNSGNKTLIEEDFLFADPDFFKIFNFKILSGRSDQLLDDPSSVVITESAALRYFGETDVVGKTITLNSEQSPTKKITGVLADPTGNSSIQFTFLAPISEFISPSKGNPFAASFGLNFATYVLLSPNVSTASIISGIIPELRKHTDRKDLVESTYTLSSFDNLKYDIEVSDDIIVPADKRVIKIFSIIAIFIISLALINYINLTSARAIKRANEVGVRKVIGASSRTLIDQMLMESLVVCVIALPLAIIALEIIIPYFEIILERKLFFDYKTSIPFLTGLLAFTLLISAIAGLYPAILLSRFKFAESIKGRPEHGRKGSLLRKVLVVFQFTFSISLIICVLLVQNQLDYIRTKTLSYAPDHIIVLNGKFGLLTKNYKTIKAELEQVPGVQKISVTSSSPGDNRFLNSTYPNISAPITRQIMDEDYIDLFNLKLIRGKNFNPLIDSTSTQVIINQTMADLLEVDDPLYSTAFKFYGKENNTIIGIVENFHFESLRDEIKPLLLTPAASMAFALTQIVVKVENTEFEQTIKNIEAVWTKFYPDDIFDYQFLDDKLDRLYTAENRLSKIFGLFTLLAILITCLGLFGLSMHMTEVKLKEVSIRKVLGASLIQIMRLLSAQVYLLVGIAAIIAAPLAWYFMNEWLQDFAYKQSISPYTFIFTLIASMALATLTTSWHTLKTARSNPAESLRNE
jgi:putative ABC transport system permease protein